MRICIDLTSLADNFSGIERYAACISLELIKNYNDTFILVFKNEIHPLFLRISSKKNVKCIVVKGKNKLFFNQVKLPMTLYKIKADGFLFLAFPVPILLFKRNMVSTIHDICCWDCPETMNGLSKWYFRISHRIALVKCKAIITISKFSKKRIHQKLKYPYDKIWLIYCGINLEDFKIIHKRDKTVKEKYNLPDEYILSLSTLEPRKNIALLISAYASLINDGYQLPKLVLAGRKGWKMDSFLKSIEPVVRKQIVFTGFIDDEDLPNVYGKATLFVFPSKYEGFGMPPLEAMACGSIVLSADNTSLPEVLGDSAFYFDNSINSLKKELLNLCTVDNDMKRQLAKKGYGRVKIFNWKREANKLYIKLM